MARHTTRRLQASAAHLQFLHFRQRQILLRLTTAGVSISISLPFSFLGALPLFPDPSRLPNTAILGSGARLRVTSRGSRRAGLVRVISWVTATAVGVRNGMWLQHTRGIVRITKLQYSRTLVERPPSSTTIPLIRPDFVWRTVFLTDDHPPNATSDRAVWIITPDERLWNECPIEDSTFYIYLE